MHIVESNGKCFTVGSEEIPTGTDYTYLFRVSLLSNALLFSSVKCNLNHFSQFFEQCRRCKTNGEYHRQMSTV